MGRANRKQNATRQTDGTNTSSPRKGNMGGDGVLRAENAASSVAGCKEAKLLKGSIRGRGEKSGQFYMGEGESGAKITRGTPAEGAGELL